MLQPTWSTHCIKAGSSGGERECDTQPAATESVAVDMHAVKEFGTWRHTARGFSVPVRQGTAQLNIYMCYAYSVHARAEFPVQRCMLTVAGNVRSWDSQPPPGPPPNGVVILDDIVNKPRVLCAESLCPSLFMPYVELKQSAVLQAVWWPSLPHRLRH